MQKQSESYTRKKATTKSTETEKKTFPEKSCKKNFKLSLTL